MERSFALLQNNVLNRQTWTTRGKICLAIITWIERTTTSVAVTGRSANSTHSVRSHHRLQPSHRNSMTRTTTVNRSLGSPPHEVSRRRVRPTARTAILNKEKSR